MHVAKGTSNHHGRAKSRSRATRAFAVVGVVLVVLSLVIVWRNDGLRSDALSILVVVDLAVLAGLALIAFLSRLGRSGELGQLLGGWWFALFATAGLVLLLLVLFWHLKQLDTEGWIALVGAAFVALSALVEDA